MKPIIDRMKVDRPVKWLFTGDSITHGALHTWGYRDYVELFAERIRYELSRRRDVIVKTAISGWTTGNIREDIDWNILQFEPDVVSLMIGMNDCCGGPDGLGTFRDNYNFILDRVLENPKRRIILHTTNPIWSEANDRRGHLPIYIDAIREIARARQLPLIDHWTYWNQSWPLSPIRRTTWMNDPIHPGNYGHRAFAFLLLRELGLWDDNANTCRLFLP